MLSLVLACAISGTDVCYLRCLRWYCQAMEKALEVYDGDVSKLTDLARQVFDFFVVRIKNAKSQSPYQLYQSCPALRVCYAMSGTDRRRTVVPDDLLRHAE